MKRLLPLMFIFSSCSYAMSGIVIGAAEEIAELEARKLAGAAIDEVKLKLNSVMSPPVTPPVPVSLPKGPMPCEGRLQKLENDALLLAARIKDVESKQTKRCCP
jgi:hypothetical protein